MHGVRRELLVQQAPNPSACHWHEVRIPPQCANSIYEARMEKAFASTMTPESAGSFRRHLPRRSPRYRGEKISADRHERGLPHLEARHPRTTATLRGKVSRHCSLRRPQVRDRSFARPRTRRFFLPRPAAQKRGFSTPLRRKMANSTTFVKIDGPIFANPFQ